MKMPLALPQRPQNSLKASIDLGTNTCLLLIAKASGEKLADYATFVRLGEGVGETGMLSESAMERTLSCLSQYADRAKAQKIEPIHIVAVATSQARDARNGAEFFKKVQAQTGIGFRILTGHEEAQATFLGGLLPGMNPALHAVIDIGGGSTELMSKEGGQSLDMGSVRFTERYLRSNPVTDLEFWACSAAIDEAIAPLAIWRKSLNQEITLVAVAGTATTLAAWHLEQVHFNAEAIDQCVLTRGDVHRLVEELKWRTYAERQMLPGVDKGREDVLLAGALILWRTMEKLNFPHARISSRGLRYGVLNSEFS